MGKVTRDLVLNGERRTVEAEPQMRLLDVIRGVLALTGTKEGCGEGECGACTVLINGDPVDSCLVLFGQLADGDVLLTIEGLGSPEHLTPLQQCFIDESGAQCGICSPGMLLSAHALLQRNPSPTRRDISRALAGNLCRCTGYVRIVDAVERAAAILRGEGR